MCRWSRRSMRSSRSRGASGRSASGAGEQALGGGAVTKRKTAIIIGGGIGGLSAAIALQRVGWEPHVFERADQLREVGAGLTMWCNGVKTARRLGIEDAV